MRLSRAERKKTHSPRSQFWFGRQLHLKPYGFLPGGATTGGEDTLSGSFFFFFFNCFHSFCHGKSFSLLCVYNFPLLIWGLAWKGIYSCLWGWASLRTIFLGKVTCWYPTNKIVLQAKMCSSHPQGQRHWS